MPLSALDRHRAFFAEGGATITLISGLAEGADRMAARAALEPSTRLSGAPYVLLAPSTTDFMLASPLSIMSDIIFFPLITRHIALAMKL